MMTLMPVKKTVLFMKTAIVLIFAVQLIGCGSLNTAIKKRDLDVQTKMSESIFLEPVAPEKRIIYVSIRNTTGQSLNLKSRIIGTLVSAGYKVTQDPEQANYMLQANMLKLEETDLRTADQNLDGGFGGAIIGSLAGGSSQSKSNTGLILGSLLGTAIDALVEDVHFTMVTDIQVRERPLKGETVRQSQDAALSQGSSTTVLQSSDSFEVQWKKYRTRVVSTANQVNLKFDEAIPMLENGLAGAIAGIFAQ